MNETLSIPETPAWGGPYPRDDTDNTGVTQSLALEFEQDPFKFFLHYYCGLVDPAPPHENLPWGDTLHKGLEHLIRGDSLHDAMHAMYDYFNVEYPTLPDVVLHTCYEMLKLYNPSAFNSWPAPLTTEHIIDTTLSLPPGRTVRVRGKADVYAPNHLCDHKCKGSIYPADTQFELGEDFQMNFYSYMLGSENWRYDLIQCPLTAYGCPEPRGQSAADYANYIFHKFNNPNRGFPISSYKSVWIAQLPFFQPAEATFTYFYQTIAPIINKICDWWDYVTDPSFDIYNPSCWNTIFYKKPVRMFDPAWTHRFKGSYYEAIVSQDFSHLVPASFYSEL